MVSDFIDEHFGFYVVQKKLRLHKSIFKALQKKLGRSLNMVKIEMVFGLVRIFLARSRKPFLLLSLSILGRSIPCCGCLINHQKQKESKSTRCSCSS